MVGRSFKYHRPRGILTAGPEEPNALVELRKGARREPNTRATTTELYDGLEAASQNRWPSLRFDLLALNSLLAPVFTAGFYYKTFMWPGAFWERVYEPLIRRAAGLGRAAGEADPDTYEHAYAFCDVLVIGSGPTGLAAALSAGRAGARVIVCEQDFLFGGRLLGGALRDRRHAGARLGAATLDELRGLPNVRLMPRTAVFGVYDGGTYGALGACQRSSRRCRRRISRGNGSGASWPSAACWPPAPSSGRWCSQATTVPGVMMASAMRDLRQPLRGPARQPRRGLYEQ